MIRVIAIFVMLFATLVCDSASAINEPEAIIKSGLFPASESPVKKSKDLPYVLMGTFIADDYKEAVIFSKNSRSFVRVKEGEKLDRFTVSSIKDKEVILSDGSQRIKLSMPSEEASLARRYITAKSPVAKKTKTLRVSTPGGSKNKALLNKYGKSSGKQTTVTKRTTNKTPPQAVNFIELIKKALKKKKRNESNSGNPFIDLLKKK